MTITGVVKRTLILSVKESIGLLIARVMQDAIDHEDAQAAAAPNRMDVAIEKAMMIALRLERAIAVLAFAIAVVIRLSASAPESPVTPPTPLFLNFAFDLLPIPFDSVPVHFITSLKGEKMVRLLFQSGIFPIIPVPRHNYYR